MTRCRRRSPWRSRSANAKDAVPRLSKGNWSAMFVAWCWKVSQRQSEQQSLRDAKLPDTNWEFSTISKVNIFRRSLEINLKPWALEMTKHVAALVLKTTSSEEQKAVWKERSNWAMNASWTGSQEMRHLQRACWQRGRMRTIVKGMTFCVPLISQSLIGLVPRWRWVFLKPRKWSTTLCALSIWISTAVQTCLIGSGALMRLGCTCTEPRSTVRRSTLIILEGLLTAIFRCQTQGLIRWRSMMQSATFGISRRLIWIRTKPMHWIRSSSQIVQKRRTRPNARPNKLLRTARVHQRKAPLTRLPEHNRKWKPPHSQHLQVRGLTALNNHNNIKDPTKTAATRVSGRNGMGAGTKRWSGMAESSGKKDKSCRTLQRWSIDFFWFLLYKAAIQVLTSGSKWLCRQAALNVLALVNGQPCRSGSPEGGVFALRV